MNLSKLQLDCDSSRYEGKMYRSYNLAHYVWIAGIDGINKKESFDNLGKLTDAEVKKWCLLLWS